MSMKTTSTATVIRLGNANVHFVRQLQQGLNPWERRKVGVQFICTSGNRHRSSAHENAGLSATLTKTNTAIDSLKQSVKEQGEFVRNLKQNGASDVELKSAVDELLRRKQELKDKEFEGGDTFTFDRAKFDILVRRRFIYDQSYEIYGGASGFYDLGPIGCALKANLLQLWRHFFILEDQMLEIDCPALTIEPVFKASGHIDRFSDFLVKDTVSNECFRVDHLIKSHLNQLCEKKPESKAIYSAVITKLEGATKQELEDMIEKFEIKSPTTGNALTSPVEFNLMFDTQIGPSSVIKGFLRPETAQGIFVNFKRLLEYNHGKLPFAAAQIGNAFRNEIAPRSGLLRVREFTMAEIEHFFDPTDKSHPKFARVKDTIMTLYSANNQLNHESVIKISIKEAVEKGLVANETLGYFMARIQQFLHHVGISAKHLRFRQHMPSEMAHYAADCWDAECLTSHGWIECVGCADRSAYDLKQHSKASGIDLTAERRLPTPKEIEISEIAATKEYLKKFSSKKSKQISKCLANMNQRQQDDLLHKISQNGFCELILDDGKTVRLDKSSVEVKNKRQLVHVVQITPNVIEPSFGIGRILYTLLEHSFRKRDGDSNSYLALPPSIAAHKCSILPLSNRSEFQPYIEKIHSKLIEENISHKIDDMSGSIGRRYVRSDEVGIPFSVTIDFDTLRLPNTVTLRERDTKQQLRIPLDKISEIICGLSKGNVTWKQLSEKFPKFEKQESTNS